MTKSIKNISQIILETFLENPKIPRNISVDSKIIEDLGLDSLAVMNFVMKIEDKLDISIPLDQLADVRTIHDLTKTIIKKIESVT